MNEYDKIWLIRSTNILSGGIVCSDFEPLKDLNSASTANKNMSEIIKNLRPDMNEARMAVNTAVAEDFVNNINIGDLAIVTNRKEKYYISIVRITGDYFFDTHNNCHVREVDPIIRISRNSLSENFRRDLRKPRAITSLPMTPDILDVINSAKKVSVENNALKAVFPLRQDFSISINIPHDMSKLEAERLADFVRTLWQVK